MPMLSSSKFSAHPDGPLRHRTGRHRRDPGGLARGHRSHASYLPRRCRRRPDLDGFGFGYEIMDFAKLVNRHMLCESGRSTTCVPEKEEEWKRAHTLDGEERRIALEAIADWQRENVYILPMFEPLRHLRDQPPSSAGSRSRASTSTPSPTCGGSKSSLNPTPIPQAQQ